MNYLKAYTAAVTAFLGLLATRQIALDPIVEGLLLASVAAAAVWVVPNRG